MILQPDGFSSNLNSFNFFISSKGQSLFPDKEKMLENLPNVKNTEEITYILQRPIFIFQTTCSLQNHWLQLSECFNIIEILVLFTCLKF